MGPLTDGYGKKGWLRAACSVLRRRGTGNFTAAISRYVDPNGNFVRVYGIVVVLVLVVVLGFLGRRRVLRTTTSTMFRDIKGQVTWLLSPFTISLRYLS